jgi:hypothetical protein
MASASATIAPVSVKDNEKGYEFYKKQFSNMKSQIEKEKENYTKYKTNISEHKCKLNALVLQHYNIDNCLNSDDTYQNKNQELKLLQDNYSNSINTILKLIFEFERQLLISKIRINELNESLTFFDNMVNYYQTKLSKKQIVSQSLNMGHSSSQQPLNTTLQINVQHSYNANYSLNVQGVLDYQSVKNLESQLQTCVNSIDPVEGNLYQHKQHPHVLSQSQHPQVLPLPQPQNPQVLPLSQSQSQQQVPLLSQSQQPQVPPLPQSQQPQVPPLPQSQQPQVPLLSQSQQPHSPVIITHVNTTTRHRLLTPI